MSGIVVRPLFGDVLERITHLGLTPPIVLRGDYHPSQGWLPLMDGAIHWIPTWTAPAPPGPGDSFVTPANYAKRRDRERIQAEWPHNRMYHPVLGFQQYTLPFREFRSVNVVQKEALAKAKWPAWDRTETGQTLIVRYLVGEMETARAWVRENCRHRYVFGRHSEVIFERMSDAIAFKMHFN